MLGVLTACGSSVIAVEEQDLADMSGYTGLTEENKVFTRSDLQTVKEKIGNKETFAVYFGFSGCPHCNDFLPKFYDLVKEENVSVYYIDTSAPAYEGSTDSSVSVEDIRELDESLIRTGDDGLQHFYVPCVIVYQDGTLVYQADSDVCQEHTEEVAFNTISILKGIDIKNE